jgi:hypothetical protein
MAETAEVLSEFPGIGAGQLKASARGGLICAVFGSAWMYWAVVFSGTPTPIWFSAVSLPAITLTTWAILRILAFRHLISSAAELQHWRSFRKFLWIDSVIEWMLVGIGTFLLSRIGRYDLIPQLFGLVIGLHFLPIAKVFQLPSYYCVGAIMIAGELCSLLLIPRGDLRNIVGCGCIGLTLWINGLIILSRISKFANRRAPVLY